MLDSLLNKFKEFQEQGPGNRDSRVLIVDGLNLFIRIFSAVPALNDNGDHIGGVVGFLKSLGATIRQFSATRCIVVFDGVGGSHRRRKLYDGYKGNRSVRQRHNRFDEFKDLVDEQASMRRQLSRIAEYLGTLPLTTLALDHVEADDIIAYLAREYYGPRAKTHVTIVSTDRDFLQLVDDKTQVWSPTKKKLYDRQAVQEEFEIHPSNYLIYRVLTGDISDNIPGVKGIGLKSVRKFFPFLLERPSTLEEVLAYSRQQLQEGTRYQLYSLVDKAEKTIKLNFELMQLHEVDIPGQVKLVAASAVEGPIRKIDRPAFNTLFLADQLYVSIPDIESWLQKTYNPLSNYAGQLR
jgi:DNA polymerase-1